MALPTAAPVPHISTAAVRHPDVARVSRAVPPPAFLRARVSPSQSSRFETLVLPHLDAAYTLARYFMRDAEEARDAAQEALLRALRSADQCRSDDARPWLLAIVRNTCHTLLRRQGAGAREVPFDEELHTEVDETPEPEAALIRAADREAVRRALDELPLIFREVIVMRELQGLSYREVADVTGVPVGTVMSRLARARERLARRLAGSGGGEAPR